MAGLRKRRRIQLIVAGLTLLAAATGLTIYALTVSGAAQYFRSPAEIAADAPGPDEFFRVGGLVEEGSLVRGQGEAVRFAVTDGAATVPVTFTGVLPDLFREGQGVIAMGRLREGVFEATEILAKHDEKYIPKEVVEALKEQGVYKEP
ncbi:MAG TPA: cytochrome c maturation protein CcmE [Paracoccaceae bacterium]|nr:cytochrome c maturation protein CcmE [Paracoccaceae bacterium]